MKTTRMGVTIDNGVGYVDYAVFVTEVSKWRSEFDRKWPEEAGHTKIEARLDDGTIVWKRK